MNVIADLIRAGVDPELVARVAEEISLARAEGASQAVADQPKEKARSSAAIRQERYRRNKASQNVTSDVTGVTSDVTASQSVTNTPSSFPPMIYNSTPQSPSPNKIPRAARENPLEVLESVLDPETAQGVVDHRRALRKPLTPLAAKMLVSAFAKTPDPNAAARLMIERGWHGFKPEWASEFRSTGPPRPQKSISYLDALIAGAEHDQRNSTPLRQAENGPLLDGINPPESAEIAF